MSAVYSIFGGLHVRFEKVQIELVLQVVQPRKFIFDFALMR